jgi:hypothetical protein
MITLSITQTLQPQIEPSYSPSILCTPVNSEMLIYPTYYASSILAVFILAGLLFTISPFKIDTKV